jgi:hypothetical protein
LIDQGPHRGCRANRREGGSANVDEVPAVHPAFFIVDCCGHKISTFEIVCGDEIGVLLQFLNVMSMV